MTKEQAAEVAPNTKMAMWDRLMPTDPKYTKAFDRGGFKGTATNGTYILKRLTEEFGPCGAGWRFVLDDEQIIEGHTLDAASGDKAKLHIVRGHLEYRYASLAGNTIGHDDPWFSTSPQYGQTMLVGRNKNGLFTDEEAPKKSITDCISKCAVLLGIAADVHLGLFDDSKYVNDRKKDVAADVPAPKADDKPLDPAKVEVKPTDVREVYFQILGMVDKATDNADIDLILKGNKGGLDELARVSPVNFEKLKGIVTDKRASFAPKDDPLNDELPSFA